MPFAARTSSPGSTLPTSASKSSRTGATLAFPFVGFPGRAGLACALGSSTGTCIAAFLMTLASPFRGGTILFTSRGFGFSSSFSASSAIGSFSSFFSGSAFLASFSSTGSETTSGSFASTGTSAAGSATSSTGFSAVTASAATFFSFFLVTFLFAGFAAGFLEAGFSSFFSAAGASASSTAGGGVSETRRTVCERLLIIVARPFVLIRFSTTSVSAVPSTFLRISSATSSSTVEL